MTIFISIGNLVGHAVTTKVVGNLLFLLIIFFFLGKKGCRGHHSGALGPEDRFLRAICYSGELRITDNFVIVYAGVPMSSCRMAWVWLWLPPIQLQSDVHDLLFLLLYPSVLLSFTIRNSLPNTTQMDRFFSSSNNIPLSITPALEYYTH